MNHRAFRFASDDCGVGIEHSIRYLNFSHNPLNDIGATTFVKLFLDF